MKADEISTLVKWCDSLVCKKKGEPLSEAQKIILRQALKNRKLEDIHVNDLSDSYVQRELTPKIWETLTEVTGHKIDKRNVSRVLPKILSEIQLQQQRTKTVNWRQRTVSTKAGRRSCSARSRFLPAPEINDSRVDNANSCYPDSCKSRERLLSNGQLGSNQQNGEQVCEPSQADELRNKEVLQESLSSVVQGLPLLAESSQSYHDNRSKHKDRSSNSFVKFMMPGVPLLLSFSIYGCLFGMSWLTNWYGVVSQLAGKLPQAQLAYKIALKLSPISAATHYNQGSAYEDQQNYERAHIEYQMAIEGGLIPAYNNQARLYILEKKYDAAVSLLHIGLPLAEHEDIRVRYSFLKNLGWARLEQDRLGEAKTNLEAAIKLQRERAPAHCLLAQVLEREGKQQTALAQWGNCLDFSYKPQLPEEDKWLEMASERLSAKELKK